MESFASRIIKGYEVIEKVGRGGFGMVYPARQPAVWREVAIKVVSPRLANQPDFIRRFEVEAQWIARLEYPHIVPLYDNWRDPQGAFLVMRWLPTTHRVRVQQGAWTAKESARLLEHQLRRLAADTVYPGNIPGVGKYRALHRHYPCGTTTLAELILVYGRPERAGCLDSSPVDGKPMI